MESETLRGFLECPICTRLPNARVYSCPNGHNLCEDCYQQISDQKAGLREDVNCPSCKEPFSFPPTRNRLAESLAISAKLPERCSFHTYGCTFEGMHRYIAQLTFNAVTALYYFFGLKYISCVSNLAHGYRSYVVWMNQHK